MNLKSIKIQIPRFIAKSLTIRDYRITKAVISTTRKQIIVTKKAIENYGKGIEIKPKEFYISLLNVEEQILLSKEDHLEDIKREMRKLGVPEE